MMSSKPQVYCITQSESQGHDNLGHTIPEFRPNCNDKKITTKDNLHEDMKPTAVKVKIGRKTGVVIDILLLVISFLWITLTEFGILPHVQQGFRCGDETISFKYQGDTVTALGLSLSALAPVLLIWAVEFSIYSLDTMKSSRALKSLARASKYIKDYFIGLVASLLVVESLKILLGELRPHFLDTCTPNIGTNCTPGEFIQNYECTNKIYRHYFITDTSRSFPSGHASTSFYEAVYIIWYFQQRFPKSRSSTLLPFVQCLCLIWACFCSVSRISDHRHHWWDVLAGMLLGIVFGGLTCGLISKNFRKILEPVETINQNGTAKNHNSVRRLLSDESTREEVTMNHMNPS